jgi:Domain of unknown function (DUF305)
MMVMMFIAGILSSMSVWADKISDVRISINDVYMALLMCAWMLLFMGLWDKNYKVVIMGILAVMIFFAMIRKQFLVTSERYITSMIPHHSMAVLMSKRLLSRPSFAGSRRSVDDLMDKKLEKLAMSIIESQESEIAFMKDYERSKSR